MLKIKPIHWKKLAKVFERDGWRLDRTHGDHLVYVKSSSSRPIVIPKDREVQIFIILNNLKTAGMKREKYFELLKGM